jgi:hypothetical protein
MSNPWAAWLPKKESTEEEPKPRGFAAFMAKDKTATPPSEASPRGFAAFRAVADKTAVSRAPTQEKPALNEYGELPTSQRILNRSKLLLSNPKEFLDKTRESFLKTHSDVIRERLGEFEGLEAMGDSLDKEHNNWNLIGNWLHKEELRKAFDKLGKHRYPTKAQGK